MTRTKFWPRLLTSTIVSIGLSIVWLVAGAWLLSVWDANFSPQYSGQERVVVEQSGRPLILTAVYGQIQSESYRTLDGELIEHKGLRQNELYPVQLPDVRQSSWPHWPEPWGWRVLNASDMRDFPGSTSWFLIKTGEKMYLEGYDDASRMRVGFIGRQGFRSSLPDRDDWFTVRGKESLQSQVTGRSVGVFGRASYIEENERSVLPWAIYALDGDRVAEINLRDRTVRTVLPEAKALSIGIVARALDVPVDADADGDADDGKGLGQVEQLVLRLPDGVEFLDPKSGETVEFKLPERIRSRRNFLVHGLPNDEILIQMSDGAEPFSSLQRRVELVRLDRTGRELETHTVELAGFVPKTDRRLSYEGVAMGPMPIAWAAFAGVVTPLNELEERHEATYSEALTTFAAKIWPALVLVAIAGVASAMAVYRWQVRYHRDHTAAWTTAALLLGPAFVAVYAIEHRGEAVARCPSCGRIVRRGRETCAACDAAFPAPALRGTEVFA